MPHIESRLANLVLRSFLGNSLPVPTVYELSRWCGKCGTGLRSGARFCAKCGQRVIDEANITALLARNTWTNVRVFRSPVGASLSLVIPGVSFFPQGIEPARIRSALPTAV